MGQILIDDEATSSPELLCVGDAAARLWFVSVCYCSRNDKLNRIIPAPWAQSTAPRRWKRAARELVRVGLWGERGRDFVLLDTWHWKFVASDQWSTAAYPEVYARDGNVCRYCGATERLTVDHVIPRCQGGTDHAANLVVCCRSCNSRKGGRTPEQAGMVLRAGPAVVGYLSADGASSGPMASSGSNDGSAHP